MRWLWPASLAGRLVLLTLASLLAAQMLSFWIFADERRDALASLRNAELFDRVATLLELIAVTPPDARALLARETSESDLVFSLGPRPLVEADAAGRARRLERRVARRLPAGVEEVRIAALERRRGWRPWHEIGDDDDAPWLPRHGVGGLDLALRLADGSWLNVVVRPPFPRLTPALPVLIPLLLAAALIGIATVLSVRRLTRPLRALADAADRAGRGEAVPPLPEEGPSEIGRSVRAFNEMQARLRRFVEDRSRMLAAVGHDLRTPITSLRLRAELVDDPETRGSMLATLEEMQAMIEATLAFLREEASEEETRAFDLTALVESIVSDRSDLGGELSLEAGPGVTMRGRPLALKRALGNLVDNALAYGDRARLRVRGEAGRAVVEIDDDGPGIAEADRERAFEPFVRLEASRNRATGGVGLGLAIARTIARRHGGEVTLENRPEGGLRVRLVLPR